MRVASFDSNALRKFLRRQRIATMAELQRELGTSVRVTVVRKLRELGYLTSYSHRGRYYTLRELAQFDIDGLWSHRSIWFSEHGTLLATAQSFVERSAKGYFAEELARTLHVEVHDALRHLVQRRRLRREEVSGVYLYISTDADTRKRQVRSRRATQAVPGIIDATALLVSPDEIKASIILFYSLLDEKQRRLYAGLESLKLGRGGDRVLADFLHLDPHTVARGREQLLSQDIEAGRLRESGGGRKPLEKKRLK